MEEAKSNEHKSHLCDSTGDSKQHRGFGFVTFQQNVDALDAVDNMHLNELNGRVRTSTSISLVMRLTSVICSHTLDIESQPRETNESPNERWKQPSR